MLLNTKLDKFLNDSGALELTMNRIKKSEKKIKKSKMLSNLTTFFDNNSNLEIEALLPEIKNIVSNNVADTLDEILKEFKAESLNDSFYTFPATGFSNEFSQNSILSANKYFQLSINLVNKHSLEEYKEESYKDIDKRGIGFYGKHQLTYFINAGGLKVSTWHYPVDEFQNSNNITLQGLNCKKIKNQTFENGEFVYFKPNETMMFEGADSNVIMLVIEFNRKTFPLSLMFSAKDLELKFQNPTHVEHSRIQLLFSLLREFDHQAAIPTIKSYLKHELHFIRWHAMQELLGLNALSAIKELKEMSINDDHKEVRKAASETLEMIRQLEKNNAN